MNNPLGLIFGIVVFLLILPLMNTTQTSLGTYEKGSCIDLIQTCGDCTYNNITSIIYPNATKIILDAEMTQRGTEHNYTYCFPELNGEYFINGEGDYYGDGDPVVWTYSLILTQSGREKLNSGEGMSLFISIIVMLIIGIFFFLISLKFESNAGKIICVGLSGIVFFIAILYSLVILDQTFGGFSTLTESYANFWMVMKVIISIILTFFTLYVFLVIFRWWNIQRGLDV